MSAIKKWDMDELLSVTGSYMTGTAMEKVKQDARVLKDTLKAIDKDALVLNDLFVSIDVGDIPVIVNTHDKRVSFIIDKNMGRQDFGYDTSKGLIKFIQNLKDHGDVVEVEHEEDTVNAIAAFLESKDIEYNQIGTSIMWNIMDQRDNIVVVDTIYNTYGYVDANDVKGNLKMDNTFEDWRDIPDLKRMNFHIV